VWICRECGSCVCCGVDSDAAPWLTDLQQVSDMARSQYAELRGVCQHLKQQNEALKRLVKQLVDGKDANTECDLGMLISVSFAYVLLLSL